MMRTLKLAVLYVARALGLFRLARRLTRGRLRILAYHGFASADEHEFRPGLFVRPETFRRRLEHLAQSGTHVLPLGEALDGLADGELPDVAVAITVDDGFYGFYRNAREMLRQYRFPATVYVTSYYCSHRAPVFRLAVQYMFWKAREQPVELAGLGADDVPAGPLRRGDELDRAQWALIEHGEMQCDEAERGRLTEEIGRRLGVDYDRIRRSRILHLMTPEELRDLPAARIDVQLHTHRHQLPDDQAGALREIAENRAFLVGLLGRPAVHFCYPSGVWSPRQWPWLEEAGVQSAVTCDPGLNDAATPRLALRRFLDGEDIAQIEFEAEVAGFLELLRTARSRMMRLVGRGQPRHAPTTI